MANCTQCGTPISDETAFCPSCGAAVSQPGVTYQNVTPQQTGYQEGFDPADIQANKGISVLSYFGILFLIPLLATNGSKFARFHAGQGLNLFIFDVILCVVQGIITTIFTLIHPVLGVIFSSLFALVWILILVLIILGIVNAVNGQAKELPVIGKFKIIK